MVDGGKRNVRGERNVPRQFYETFVGYVRFFADSNQYGKEVYRAL